MATSSKTPPPATGGKLEGIAKKDAKRILLERVAIGGVLFLVLVAGIAGWVTDGRAYEPVINFLKTFEPEGTQSRNKAVSCRDPRNKNTPFCQNSGGDSNWRSTSKGWGGGSGGAFGIGGK